MADAPNDQIQHYEPDPAEVKKAYWILFGIFIFAALFIGALIETVVRHGNPFDVIGGGGAGH